MLGIVNSDSRMNLVYQKIKDQVDCILLDDFSDIRVKFDEILLPMSGLRDDDVMIVRGIEMKCPKEFFNMLKGDGRIICGNVTPKLKELEIPIIDLNDKEPFILANSKLTAEGVLYLILDNTDYGLLDLSVDIIGYGHSGKAIYELLKDLNVKVRCIRRNVIDKHEDFMNVSDYQKVKPYQVIINTSLTNIFDDLMLKKMDDNLIINLVRSANFNEVLLRQRRCRIVHAGPLPALFSSRSAANVLYETIMEILYEN